MNDAVMRMVPTGGAWLAAAIALRAAAEGAPAPPERLPPGARPPAERAFVETRSSSWGERYVEPLDPSAPEQAKPAAELEYTTDPALEAEVREVLAREGIALAHVLVMDARSGELFAYVSSDPGRLPPTRAYPTASLMKIVTAAALLRHVPAATARRCRSVGNPYVLREAHLERGGQRRAAQRTAGSGAPASGGGGHAAGPDAIGDAALWIGSFREALSISNNQCFARHAVVDLGREKLLAEMRRVGMFEAPGPRHAAGTLDPIESRLDLGSLGSGLAGSAITPLGALRLAGLLATGHLSTPHWIARRFDPEGPAFGTFRREPARRVWDSEIADTLRDLLVGVTEEGTARRAFADRDGTPRLGPIPVSGKTGTLRGDDPEGLYQWFVGVAPADAPRLAIAALVVHPDDAERGSSASEVAAATLQRIFCDAAGDCATRRAEALGARSAARTAEIARLHAATAAAAAEAAAEREGRLDAPLRPLPGQDFELPIRLRRRSWEGKVVLRVEVDPDGRVVAAAVDESDLPTAFGEFLVEEVAGWRFTGPRRDGRPVAATARVPIAIRVD